jgi:hypothetical protein
MNMITDLYKVKPIHFNEYYIDKSNLDLKNT